MKLDDDFFARDVLQAAPGLVGKLLVRRMPDGSEKKLRITETEAYRGEADTACHAHHGRTKRTEILYRPGGTIYVYLCYGMHWLVNIVTGPEDFPQAALIRACEGAEGPGKLTRALAIDGCFNGLAITRHPDLWVEDDGAQVNIISDKRVGIGYASKEDQERLWRFKKG
jgi:DNA-3-methyladenine glycosylase